MFLTQSEMDADKLHEECGVFGVWGVADAAASCFLPPCTPPLPLSADIRRPSPTSLHIARRQPPPGALPKH